MKKKLKLSYEEMFPRFFFLKETQKSKLIYIKTEKELQRPSKINSKIGTVQSRFSDIKSDNLTCDLVTILQRLFFNLQLNK